MKILILLVLVFTGCNATSALHRDIRASIPDGNWETVDTIVTGKFSSTTIKGRKVVKHGDSLTAEELHIRHSNVYIPLIQIDTTGFTPLDVK